LGSYLKMQTWRLIIDQDGPGDENMARDESLLRAADLRTKVPTLRLYGWRSPAISVGYIQNPSKVLPFGLPVVRRITGGRAVIHDMELTYSITAPTGREPFAEGINGAYSAISVCIINALKDIGVDAAFSRGHRSGKGAEKDACFHSPSRYEVLVNGKKLVGSSQRRLKNAFLQHGSIIFGVNRALHERIFGEGIVERMSWIGAHSGVAREAFRDILVKRFAEGFMADFKEAALDDDEENLKDELLKAKYLTEEWNHNCVRRYKDPLALKER